MTLRSAAGCARAQVEVERALRTGRPVVLLVEAADLAVVDAVARMRVLADRLGGQVRVVGDRDLIGLCGLDEVL